MTSFRNSVSQCGQGKKSSATVIKNLPLAAKPAVFQALAAVRRPSLHICLNRAQGIVDRSTSKGSSVQKMYSQSFGSSARSYHD